ncbi:MAG: hypothetical protein FJ026_09265, partial [Chloroflexi bacterium]|nr:hypothetical protein [Chloroflexota bacterium]
MQRMWMVRALLPVLLLASCARAAQPSAAPTTALPAAASIPTATSAPAAWPTQEFPVLDLSQVSDLSTLDSYTMHYVLRWESRRAEE